MGGLTHELRWKWKLARLALSESRRIGHHRPASYLATLRTSYDLYSRYGFLPDEAARLGLLQQPAGVERRYVSKRQLVARQRALNHPSFQELTEDKAIFYAFCTRSGLAVPRLLAVFLAAASGVAWEGRPLEGEADWVEFFARECPDEFVVKPSRGVYGEGILFIDKRAPGFSAAALYRRLRHDRTYSSFVVQECLANHPDLQSLCPSRGLQTCRVITFVRPDMGVDVLMAYLKPIGGDNRIDNHNSGRTGNLLCPIDVRSGTLGRLMTVTEGGVRELPAHPVTGKSLEGQLLPLWDDVRSLAQQLALGFMPMRAIGWDIAVTPRGAVCVEGNARWDPPKFGDVGPLAAVLGWDVTGRSG